MITQVRISDSLPQFKENFKKLWGLVDYHDPEAPALFLGIYPKDVQAVKDHKGFKLLFFTGSDMRNAVHFRDGEVQIVVSKYRYEQVLKQYLTFPVTKFSDPPIKDYRGFVPCPLGDKIYCYQNRQGAKNYGLHTLQKLMDEFGKDRFIIGYGGHSMDWVIEKYYKRSFLNLQLNPFSGFTTVLEMAHMGRPSMSNFPNDICSSYQSFDMLVMLIKEFDHYRMSMPNTAWSVHLKVLEMHLKALEIVDYSIDWLNPKYYE